MEAGRGLGDESFSGVVRALQRVRQDGEVPPK